MSVKAENEPIAEPRDIPDGASWADEPIVIKNTQYQYDGSGIVEPAHRHIFIMPADGGTAFQLTEGNFNHSVLWNGQ